MNDNSSSRDLMIDFVTYTLNWLNLDTFTQSFVNKVVSKGRQETFRRNRNWTTVNKIVVRFHQVTYEPRQEFFLLPVSREVEEVCGERLGKKGENSRVGKKKNWNDKRRRTSVGTVSQFLILLKSISSQSLKS